MSRAGYQVLILSGLVLAARPAASAAPRAWEGLEFLLGEWRGAGNGTPGSGVGGFTLEPDLAGRVLLRRSHADYPATPSRPAFRHEDLTVIYPDPERGGLRALYTDSEGHAIDYRVTVDAAARRVTFTSEPDRGAPRYRLVYVGVAADSIALRFEIAPPGRPDSLALYLEAGAHRVAR